VSNHKEERKGRAARTRFAGSAEISMTAGLKETGHPVEEGPERVETYRTGIEEGREKRRGKTKAGEKNRKHPCETTTQTKPENNHHQARGKQNEVNRQNVGKEIMPSRSNRS